MKILLVSKDRSFCDSVRLAFAREGCAVRVSDRQGIWSRANQDDDVMILHAMKPAAAARWCRLARRVRPGSAIVACCNAIDAAGIAGILDAGADDAMAITAPAAELLARVRAVCRRARTVTLGPNRVGAILIDPTTRTVAINNIPVSLRRSEFRLLSYLVANPDRVIGSRELMEDVFGGEHTGDNALVRVHLSQLRRKLGAAGAAIETVRGQGYRLVAEASEGFLKQSA